MEFTYDQTDFIQSLSEYNLAARSPSKKKRTR